MRILLISDYATSSGGAEVAILHLRQKLRERGHDARIFSTTARPAGMRVCSEYRCFGTITPLRVLLQTVNPGAFFGLRGVIRSFKPHVVHVHLFLTQLSPLILPLLKNIPSIHHVRWLRPVCPTGSKRMPDGTICQRSWGAACYHEGCVPFAVWPFIKLQMTLWQRWIRVFNATISLSHAVKAAMAREHIGSTIVLWNGIPSSSSCARPPLSNPPTVAFSGRLVRVKGVDVLIRAFSKVLPVVPSARLLIAGEGPEKQRLQRLANRLGIGYCTLFTGFLQARELEQHFASAWVQAVPSVWVEALSRAAQEAMMRGTAVIASDIGGLAEIVQNEDTGLLVSANDVRALGAALLRLLTHRELAEKMGRAGRRFAVAHFDENRYIERLTQLYSDLRKMRRKTGQQPVSFRPLMQ